MNKREKILVILTIVVAIGAGLFLFLDQDPKRQPQTPDQSQAASPSPEALALLQEQGKEPEKMKPSEYQLPDYEQHLIKAASRPWPEDIFHSNNPAQVQNTLDTALHYSGYLQTNGQYLAIVNGRPFACGEYLQGTEWPEYRIESINPKKVVLTSPQGKQRTLVLQANSSLGSHNSNALTGTQE
ncbi:MAG: hypothetical protein KGY41_01210 [Desulfovermiculus sp.]|nr:hypothetical protein [Desulfovermiculus sp.]